VKLVKVDKTLAASIALHLAVVGWGLISFQSKAFEITPGESLPVDVISSDQLAKVMAGMKTGKKENPKPLVEKVAEAKPPIEDQVGKITEKPPVETEVAPKPAPPVEKPIEKKPEPPKPEPPKPVVEKKPEPPKPADKKPDPPKIDPIAEALKKEPPKEKPKPVQKAAVTPPPQERIQERHFDQTKIAALLDKREPSRNAATGSTLNSNAALGLAKGAAADNSATWGALFKSQVERCWKKPYGGIEAQMTEAIFSIKLKKDGSLEAQPMAVSNPTSPYFRVYQESALRAIIECQPYKLPAAYFEEWKFFEPVFTERRM
jgi:outer membrane biosynthesis protein TonB